VANAILQMKSDAGMSFAEMARNWAGPSHGQDSPRPGSGLLNVAVPIQGSSEAGAIRRHRSRIVLSGVLGAVLESVLIAPSESVV